MLTKFSLNPLLAVLPALGSMLLLGTFAVGCADPAQPGDFHTQALDKGTVPAEVDILFMIDNSGSMREEQDKLRRNFPVFIDSLRALPGGLPNLHIGIVSSDVGAGSTFISGNPACNRPGGDKGELQLKPGCGVDSGSSNFLISLNNDTQHNYAGKLQDVFACMADLGTGGCGFEHQLQSIRLALKEQITPANGGFLRTSAFLMIILVTDEDDCSGPPTSTLYADPGFEGQTGSLRCNIAGHLCNGLAPPASPFMTPLVNCAANPNGLLIPIKTFVDDLRALKPNHPERIIVSAITGMPKPGTDPVYQFMTAADPGGLPNVLDVSPICSSGPDGTAAPALRITEFVKSFGANGTLESICDNDFSSAFGRLGALLGERVMAPASDAGTVIDTLKMDAGSSVQTGMGGSTVAMDGGSNATSGTSTGGTKAPEAMTNSGGANGAGGQGPIDERTDNSSGCSCKMGAHSASGLNNWGALLFVALAFARMRRRLR